MEGGCTFPRSSRGLKDLQQELGGACAAIGPSGSPGSRELRGLLLGGGLQELACDSRVLDGGVVADPEYGGEVQGVGAAGEGFLELPVDAEPFEGGRQAAA